MRLAVICPQRGITYTEVVASMFRELNPVLYEPRVFMSHNIPVPRAFNELVKASLEYHPDWILFWEEDVVPPDGSLKEIFSYAISHPAGAYFLEYPLPGGWSSCVEHEITHELLYGGLGFTLVKASVFKEIPFPWFRADKAFRLNDNAWIDVPPEKQYGLYDINFFCQMRKRGHMIERVAGICRHLKLEKLGTPQVNNGIHVVGEKSDFIKPSTLPVDPMMYL